MRQIPIRSCLVLLCFWLTMLGERNNIHPLDWTLQQARHLGLMESVLEKAQRTSLPALHLEHTNDASLSWIGGLPLVPADFHWPRWHGQPLSFLAQLDLEEVTAAFQPSWLPRHGQLYFFFADEAQDLEDGYSASDRGAWRVIYTDATRSTLTQANPPTHLDTARFPHVSVAFRPIASVPSNERLMSNWELSDAEFIALDSAQNAPFRGQPRHQLFGLPYPEQNDGMELDSQLAANGIKLGFERASHDPRIMAGATRWRLLLQVDTDDTARMMWGDAGLLYFWIREEDAAQRDFSNVWMILQSG